LFLQRVAVHGYRAACDEEIVCELPGRFSVVVGANGTGKTSVTEAMYLAHRHVFPQIQRPPAAALAPRSERFVEVAFEYEDPEQHAWWSAQQLNGVAAPAFRRQLEPSMGRVRAKAIGIELAPGPDRDPNVLGQGADGPAPLAGGALVHGQHA
jgi:putative ATP-dependent endonuclease of OLD family